MCFRKHTQSQPGLVSPVLAVSVKSGRTRRKKGRFHVSSLLEYVVTMATRGILVVCAIKARHRKDIS